MMFTKEQASLIWVMFRLQNSERKISEFTKLSSKTKEFRFNIKSVIINSGWGLYTVRK